MYISKDPIGLVGGFALYGYVKDSNTQVDILGLSVYELIAKQDGWYPVFKRGSFEPIAYTKLKKGDVYKIGESKNAKYRYSKVKLDEGIINKYSKGGFVKFGEDVIPIGLEMNVLSEGGTKTEDLALEKKLLKEYIDKKGELPAGNKVCR